MLICYFCAFSSWRVLREEFCFFGHLFAGFLPFICYRFYKIHMKFLPYKPLSDKSLSSIIYRNKISEDYEIVTIYWNQIESRSWCRFRKFNWFWVFGKISEETKFWTMVKIDLWNPIHNFRKDHGEANDYQVWRCLLGRLFSCWLSVCASERLMYRGCQNQK